MSKLKRFILALVIVLALPATVFFFFPGTVYNLTLSIDRIKAGLVEKSIRVGDHRIVYLEGGRGETVILVHGFGADKDNWTRFARNLTSSYHVIIPDLPGFGESTRDMNAVYDIETQVSRLKMFADAMGLKKFHIAGNSMGGSIAGVFAVYHGDMVITLALVNSSGVKSPEKSDYQRMLESGMNPLLVNNAVEFDNMLDMIFFKKPSLPSPVKRYLAERSIRNRPFHEKVMKDRRGLSSSLEANLGRLEMPVLILWGDHDRLIDVSCVDVLAGGIKNSTRVIMKDCGHVPMLERPDESAGIYLKFLIM